MISFVCAIWAGFPTIVNFVLLLLRLSILSVLLGSDCEESAQWQSYDVASCTLAWFEETAQKQDEHIACCAQLLMLADF